VRDIYFTESLALKDDKYQPYPNLCDSTDEGITECNRAKYWFKQWWQIRFSSRDLSDGTHYWYEIFSDLPSDDGRNFDLTAHYPDNETAWQESIAKYPGTNKYLIGICDSNDNPAPHYPPCSETDQSLDLTAKYGIKKMEFVNFYSLSKRLVFDNLGNIYLQEGDAGDSGDYNPLDSSKRKLLTTTAKIRLCLDVDSSGNCKLDKGECIQVNITPGGAVYESDCE